MINAKAYAVAVMDLCKENNKDINIIVNELNQINKSFDDEIIKFFKSPKVSTMDKKEVIKNTFYNKIDKDVYGLLMVLVDNSKVFYINDIIDEINKLLEKEQGIVTVEAISYEELQIDEIDQIITFFENRLNKKIKLVKTIDKNLVGGLVLKYNGKIIDGSLIKRSESLKEYLKK